MLSIDINCDMGEGMNNEKDILPFISSANIACGYHAGDENTMRSSIQMAAIHKVNIGAHPSFADREHFGRTILRLPATDIYTLIKDQLTLFNQFAIAEQAVMQHVKPHGALYNLSAADADTAKAIAHAVKDFDTNLVLYGLSGSHSITAAKAAGLKTVSEVFADRTYQADGTLTPRVSPNAFIEDEIVMLKQAIQMVTEKKVTSVQGTSSALTADSICIHGDGLHAAAFARKLFETLTTRHIIIRPTYA